ARGVEPVRRRRPAGPRPGDIPRMARGRTLSRHEHPRIRRPLPTTAAAGALARGGLRRGAGATAQPRGLRGSLGPARLTEARPAFYALAPGGWRDYATLLHPPYTAWHLSYVAIGATLAPQVYWDRLGAALAAFFLALGVAAHALDELNGRPLATRIRERTLVVLTAVSLAGAVAIGIAGAVAFDLWLLVFVA